MLILKISFIPYCILFTNIYLTLKVEEIEFVDDYERPVLEKYEKITPTPIEKKKKVHVLLLHYKIYKN